MAVIEARGAVSSETIGYAPREMHYAVFHFVLIALTSGLAVTAVILRLLARKIQNQAFMLPDYLIVLGLAFALAETGVSIYGCCFPIPERMGDVPQETGLQLMFLAPILWMAAVTTIRAAIILLYIRTLPNRLFSTACYVVLVMNMLFGASAILADCFICRPIEYRWATDTVSGSCGDQKSLDMYIAIVNLLHDVVVVILPMPVLWKLKLAIEKKIALTCMFGLGILVCAITIYRIRMTSIIGDVMNVHLQDTLCNIALLTSLEALLGVSCACLPFLKPLLHKLHGSLSKHWTTTTKSFTSGGVPIASRAPRLPYFKQYFNGLKSTTDSFWCEKEVKIREEPQDSL